MKKKATKKIVRRVWSGIILISDRPPGGKLPVDRKFLPKKDIEAICRNLEKKSGYTGVAISIPHVKIAITTKE